MKFRQSGGQDIAIPVPGYKSHIAIDRRYGFIRAYAVTDAACDVDPILLPISRKIFRLYLYGWTRLRSAGACGKF